MTERPRRVPLKTSLPRMAIAVAVGLLFPLLVLGTPMAALLSAAQGEPVMALLGYLFIAIPLVPAALVLGAPLWIVLHRRGARTLAAGLAGAALSLAVGVAIGVIIALDRTRDYAGMRWLVPWLTSVPCGLVGWGTWALMWKLAYPKALQPPPPESVF